MLTHQQRELYEQLLTLTKTNEAFYFKDYEVDEGSPTYEATYRVFNYRLASYTDFMLPGALEARGITFLMNSAVLHEKEPVALVCRPWKKFFNLDESPMTMNLDLSKENIHKAAVKEDGSMICTFYNPYTKFFGVKSKQDFFSDQAKLAGNYLNINSRLKQDLLDLTKLGNTVIMELVSPYNRIVLPYQKTMLKILGVRRNSDGSLWDLRDVIFDFPELEQDTVEEYFNIPQDFILGIPSMTNMEGYVITLTNTLMFKVKTDWYRALHHLKDSVDSPRRLFEAIILEAIDDVKSMFSDDKAQMDRIKSMEDKVIPKFNSLIKTVEEFYETNKDIDRKGYAIKGQQELGLLFNLAMMKYLNKLKDFGYKEFAVKFRKEYFSIEEETDLTLINE